VFYSASFASDNIGLVERKDPIDKKMEECISRNQTTLGMNKCGDEALVSWDRALNDAYNQLVNKIDKNGVVALRKSQREWVKFRDADFEFINSYYNDFTGSIYSNMNRGSKIDRVKKRVLELRGYIALLDNR
jgi:uncharacterized protein YecT (DUF1311 family)